MPEACSQFRSYEAAGERAFRWRISRVAPRIPGDSPRASFPRPFRPHESGRSIGVVPGLHIGFTGFHLRIPGILPGLHSRGLSGRRRAGVSVADFPGLHLGFTGFHLRIPGILPGLHSRGLSGRRRCAAVSGSRGFSPGFIPAAIQAAGERAIDWRSPGVAHPILGVSSPNPGDSPRASFPRPVRPQESGRFGGRFPGLHLGFPGILPGLHSRGLSGRRRCAAVSGSRGFSPGFIPVAIQAAGELKRSFELPGREMGDRLRCRFGPRRG